MATLSLFDNFRLKMMNGNAIDFGASGDDIKGCLVASGYTLDAANHDFYDDLTNEVTGTNYTAGGDSLASKTLNLSGGTVTFDAADITWSQHASGFTDSRRLIVYYDSGVDATSPLIAYSADFGADKGNVAGNLTMGCNASGIITCPQERNTRQTIRMWCLRAYRQPWPIVGFC